MKIVQRANPAHHRSERRGNLRIAHIREVLFAIYVELVNLRAKRVAHLPRVAGELHDRLALGHFDVLESMRAQPVCHGLNIRIRWPKLPAKLFRRRPPRRDQTPAAPSDARSRAALCGWYRPSYP